MIIDIEGYTKPILSKAKLAAGETYSTALIWGQGGGRLLNKGGGLLYEKWFWFLALF
jgi:hypothetical protein